MQSSKSTTCYKEDMANPIYLASCKIPIFLNSRQRFSSVRVNTVSYINSMVPLRIIRSSQCTNTNLLISPIPIEMNTQLLGISAL